MPSPVDTWLAHGDAAEADWGGHVTRLALRDDLGSGGAGLLLDLPALGQPFACVSNTCAPALRPARTKSCCADLDVTLTPNERDAITPALPEVATWMTGRDPRWADGTPAIFDGDTLRRPSKRCVFAAQGPEGLACALHVVEDASGRPRGTLKPMPCRLFPLVLVDLGEGRVLLSAVTRRTARHVGLPSATSFPCLRGDTTRDIPLVESVEDTLVELWGKRTARGIVRSVAAWRGRQG
jgi:hypothetical protein